MPHVIVIYTGAADPAQADKYDTYIQAQEITASAREAGWEASMQEFCWPAKKLAQTLSAGRDAVIFNLIEEIDGKEDEQYKAVEWLSDQGYCFTGSAPATLQMAFDKIAIKKALARSGIATPAYYSHAHSSENPPEDGRYIVKSLDTHGSVGISTDSVVNGLASARARIDACAKQTGGVWFAEAYIEGREITATMLEVGGKPVLLPLIELEFTDPTPGRPKILCYNTKWDTDSDEYDSVNEIFLDTHKEPDLAARLEALSFSIWNSLQLQDYARLDFRVNEEGLWLIDVTARPSLALDAFVCNAGRKAGLDQTNIVKTILESADRRRISMDKKRA